jgi:hypothetical protein
MGICPKKAVTAVNASRPGTIFVTLLHDTGDSRAAPVDDGSRSTCRTALNSRCALSSRLRLHRLSTNAAKCSNLLRKLGDRQTRVRMVGGDGCEGH